VNPKRAVGYVRVSVDRAEETSTATQEERIRAYCLAHGWEVVDVIVEPGRSAYKASRSSRPGFGKAMALVTAGAADVLVVWKLDRACRDTVDTLLLVDELAGYGAQFVSVTEGFDTSTATGRMILTVLAALAEMESATKSERTQAWQEHRRAAGAVPTGPRPYGYRRGGPDNPNVLTIDEAEAEVIREAADRVVAGQSLRSIVADLAQRGVTSSKGTLITPRTLRGVLLNPTVVACREVDGGGFVRSNGWDPILTLKQWDDVRAILSDPNRRTGPGSARRWLLTGIAVCGRCEDTVTMGVKPHMAGPRYSCPVCTLSINAVKTDELVEGALLALLDRKAWRRLRQGQTVGADTSGFEEAMAELTARFVAGDLSGDEVGKLADALRQEVTVAPPPSLPDVDDLAKAWSELDIEQRRLVFITATESLTILPTQYRPGFDESRVQWVPVP
jgi:DNA invertase Pin-like site-specific DNA recombinase